MLLKKPSAILGTSMLDLLGSRSFVSHLKVGGEDGYTGQTCVRIQTNGFKKMSSYRMDCRDNIFD